MSKIDHFATDSRTVYVGGFSAGCIVSVIVAAVLIAGPVQWWFTAVGERDARALIEADRQAAMAKCGRGALAYTIHTYSGDERGCFGGSARMAKTK
jgi:hypothetical protein